MSTDPGMSTPVIAQTLSATESAIAVLWSEVLQLEELPGANDNFFSLGGDSIAMIMVEHRIKEEFAVELPAGTILAAASLCELSALVDTKRSNSSSATAR